MVSDSEDEDSNFNEYEQQNAQINAGSSIIKGGIKSPESRKSIKK